MSDSGGLATENEALRERIRDLEYALSGAIWLDRGEWQRVSEQLRLTPSESAIVVLAFKAQQRGSLITRAEVGSAMPSDRPLRWRKSDGEPSSSNAIGVFLHNIRKRRPGLVELGRSGRNGHIRLTDEGMARVGEIFA